MGTKGISIFLAIVLAFGMIITAQAEEASKTVTESELGTHDGYDYELWKDSGTTSMVLGDAGAFRCSWSEINNALFRKGLKFDQTKTYEELGNIVITYDCDYNPTGNSYLCVYGWTADPLVEYYIVDSWGSWRPPGATPKATITVDDGTYDVYETTRTEQPSIQGTATFQQYWSVRTSKRTSGTISVSEHFRAWESLGMNMGNMYEASLLVEGYQSSGTADILSNVITVGGDIPQTAVVVSTGEAEVVIREGTAAFGTPALDGGKDGIWAQAEPMPMDKMLIEPYAASGTARALWDADNLYVLFEVNDSQLDNSAEAVHEKDSAEAFVDEANCKLGSYKQDDGQYRVCYDGSQSFGDSTDSNGFESVVTVDGSSYTVEMKIPFKTLKPEAGKQIGFDAQVNDAQGGARTGISKWSDASDNSWQDTSAWGVVTLLAPESGVSGSDTPDNNEFAESTPEAVSPDVAAENETTEKDNGLALRRVLITLIAVGICAVVFALSRRKRK